MKKSDIAMIILIASGSVLFAYLIMNQIPLLKDVNKPVVIKTATPIDPNFTSGCSSDKPVDPTIFHTGAVNPTVKITIGEPQPTSGE